MKPLLVVVALVGSGCRFVSASSTKGTPKGAVVVRITATPDGCQPKPAHVRPGLVEIDATNLDAPTISEIEIRSGNLSEVLGEKENLIEGLSTRFTITLNQGRYVVDCPGAVQGRWTLLATAATRDGAS